MPGANGALGGDLVAQSAPDGTTLLLTESGYPGFVTGSWQRLLAAGSTPADIVAKLNAEFARALAIPEIRDRLMAQRAEPRPTAPAQFAEFLRNDTAKWAQLATETAIKLV